jgi:hypothetical protein
MIPIQIKNWLLDENGISWVGTPPIRTIISRDEIVASGVGNRMNTFDLILHMSERDGVTEDDIYALNTALFYAIEVFNLVVPNEMSFVSTVNEQRNIFLDKIR